MSTIKRRNRINEQFAARTIPMLESPAYRVLSLSAHKVISRLEIELAHHGGNDNGKLPVTTDQFVEYGMHRTSVAPAIREAEALGFIRITDRGRGGNAEYRTPNKFFLTFAHCRNSRKMPPTHDWHRIETVEEAERIARAARANKDERAVEHGRRSWRKRQQKQRTSTEKPSNSVRHLRTEQAETPVRMNGTTVSGEQTEPLSISRVRERVA